MYESDQCYLHGMLDCLIGIVYILQLPSHSSCLVPFIKEKQRYRIYTALKEKSIYFNELISSDTEKPKYQPNNGILKFSEGYNLEKSTDFN